MVLVIIGILAVLAAGLIALYNRMMGLSIRVKEAWAGIDAQLKRRYDLIPNLVDTVKGYMSHERKTFEEVTRLRNEAMNASGPAGKASAEGGLTQALKTIFALAEAYPQLKSNENFLSLQKNLSDIEDAIQYARRYYNAVVRDFNISTATFPGNLLAGIFGFKSAEFFGIAEEEKAVPKVQF